MGLGFRVVFHVGAVVSRIGLCRVVRTCDVLEDSVYDGVLPCTGNSENELSALGPLEHFKL